LEFQIINSGKRVKIKSISIKEKIVIEEVMMRK
jgi:hypothetical protein